MTTTLRKVTLGIDGMTCSSCSNTVENALRTAPGVKQAAVNLTTNTATVEYNSSETNDKKLADEVESVGFGADVLVDELLEGFSDTTSSVSPLSKKETSTLRSSVLGIEGMTCSSCSGTVENAIRCIAGVNGASVVVALSTNTATFQYDSATTSAAAVSEEIESVGFGAEILQDESVVNDDIEANSGKSTSTKGRGGAGNNATADAGIMKTMLLLIEEIPHAQREGSAATAVHARGFSHSPLATGDSDSLHSGNEGEIGAEQGGGAITEASLRELRDEIEQLPGVQSAELRGADAQIKVTYDDFQAGPRDFHRLAAARGLSCTVCSLGGFMMATRLLKNQAKEAGKLYAQLVLASSLTAPIFCITMILGMIPACKKLLATEIFPGLAVNGALLFLLSFPVQFYVGHQFHSKAWKSLKTGTLGMDFLVSTGTLAAYLYSSAGLIMGIVAGVPNMRDVEYFETSAVLITAVLLGKYLEVYAKGQTAAAIHKLSKLKAHTARLVTSGTAETHDSSALGNHTAGAAQEEDSDRLIDAALLHRRDVVRLVAGETVPADGELLAGAHVGVDEAMMTGESALVAKGERDTVFGGTMVIEGSALMRVTACGDDSTLGRIISTVQQAQASKPPIQELADRVARYFVPVIALTSLLTFTVWLVAYWAGGVPAGWYAQAGNPYLFAFFFALAVWVSACPCAFGLATPTAVLVATGVAAKHGILIRKGAALQYASNVNVVAFDKTGTLTKGSTEVTDFLYRLESAATFGPLQTSLLSRSAVSSNDPSQSVSKEARYLLQLMHLAECRSSHPLAKGITAFCKTSIASLDRLIDQDSQQHSHRHSPVNSTQYALPSEQALLFDVIPGLGIRMYTPPADGSTGAPKSSGPSAPPAVDVLVGSGKLLQSMNVPISAEAAARASSYRAGGKVAVYVSLNGALRAIAGVSDAVRPEAAHVIRALHSRGIACYMITGDEATTAHAIAQAVGIPASRILARAKPEDKKAFIEALQSSHLSLPSRRKAGGSGSRGARYSGKKLNVAFVGDGTNDSPALAVAEVGFTMASGSDIAVEAGDMVLCKNDLQALLVALDLSQQTMRRIQINYFWALCYNACLVPVAAGVLYPAYHFALAPMLAGMAMALSSVSIVVSSLWLARYQPPVIFRSGDVAASAASSNHDQCDCPASSALEIAVEQPSPLLALWRHLTGDTSASTRTTEEALLTPAEWRQAQQVGATLTSFEAFAAHGDAEGDHFGEGEAWAGDSFAAGDDAQSGDYTVLQRMLRAVGIRSAHSKRAEYSDYVAVQNPVRGDGDIELGVSGGKGEYKYDSASYNSTLVRRNGSGESVHGLLSKAASKGDISAVVKGCGCGKGNCKCGNSCMCGDTTAKIARVK